MNAKTPALVPAPTSNDEHGDESGFTLVELLVVLTILGSIMLFAVPRVLTYLSGAREDAAAIQIERIGGILDLYALDTGRYPTSDEGLQALVEEPPGLARWRGPYLKNEASLIDPWGQPYDYRQPGDHGPYDLLSYGSDGQEGGEDEAQDVTSW